MTRNSPDANAVRAFLEGWYCIMEKYEIIRSNRRTISIEVKADGRVIVRCPEGMPERDVRNFVESKSEWINRHRAGLEQTVVRKFSDAQIQSLRVQTKELVMKRAAHYASVMGVSYNRITVRVQHTRWGSCSSKGNLNFNCLLALVPPEVLDYVVVHELCHLKQMNHSSDFWLEVESVLPDYERHKRWLKENGRALIGAIQ